MLAGSKTYLLIAASIALAIAAFLLSAIDAFLFVEAFFAGLAVASARAGIAKVQIFTELIPQSWATEIGLTLPGYKTHLAVAALILTALLAWITGAQSLIVSAIIILAALGLSAQRAAIQRIQDFFKKRYGL